MIKLFYGPKSQFDKILSEISNTKSLSQLVVDSDKSKRNLSLILQNDESEDEIKKKRWEKPKVSNLVARTEEYSIITESAISSFISVLEEYSIQNIYLQNPPDSIKEQMLKYFPYVKIENTTYKSLNVDILYKIADEFDKNIIGQEEVKKRILGNLYFTSKHYRKKPVVLMFYGPTGVGKTESAKFLSKKLGGNLFRKQFSMYHNNEFSDYIFGAKHNQPSLTKDLLERESNVILFDEFDKPNPVFFSAFYQMFDEGLFVDKNYHVNLEGSIIICTSNFKSENDIKKTLGDAIYSRFDDFIEFENLSEEASKRIIFKKYNEIIDKLDEEDKKTIQDSKLLDSILGNASKLKNTRHINKVITHAISNTIIQEKILK